ncbi:MAG: phosphate ABC transporter substrate-binding protein PstS [Terriglobia bacterium]|nr:phosphate ABC transporter substrate-binding protein PstS [Terriglobia bacterium]
MKALHRTLLCTASFAVLLLLVACNSSNKSGVVSPNANGNPNKITGAGSTFVYPVMSRWIADYQKANPNIQINYQSIGSGGGIQQLKKGLVDFGASDAALNDQQLKEMPPIMQIPESAGPVCITYNIPELKEPLKLTPAALAGIYLGTIKNWHDKEIASANPGVKLPSSPMVVAHRSDGSGTTNIFTNYLAAVSPEWKSKVGAGISVGWPVGLGGKGSEGVTGIVKQNPGGIGYVELTYAEENHLPVALMRNAAGQWVPPTAEAATAAINAYSAELAKDTRIPIVNPPASAKDAYPISGLTYLLVPTQPKNVERGDNVKKFIQYVITDGQSQAVNLHYAKLPQSLIDLDQKMLGGQAAGEK